MIKVASYCRVSTDQEDQANSFESQQRYFREYIQHCSDWELYEVYADEGITGTSTKRRTQFNRMIRDAYDGKFQIIVTEEVSRFSRNILDTISYTRELKAAGVTVRFLLDGIDTANADAELYLSIMASMAQEESRKTSSRVVWGQTRQMERGVVFGHSMLGYDVKDGKISINPQGAELVRCIYQKYAVEKWSTYQIAKYLTQEQVSTYRGNTAWKAGTIVKILKNPKYAGDLVQKKTYTPDYLTHEKKRNNGQVPLICIENHHEPIVSKDLWLQVQKRLEQNNKHHRVENGHSNRYVFSGKIKCSCCGASFVGRTKILKDGRKVRRWRCGTAVRDGTAACGIGRLIRDEDALDLLKAAIKRLQMDKAWILGNVTSIVMEAIRADEASSEGERGLQSQLARIKQKTEALLDSYFSKEISREEMRSMKKRYHQQEVSLQSQLQMEEERAKGRGDLSKSEESILSLLQAVLNCETESELFYKTILDHMNVFQDKRIQLWLNSLEMIFIFFK